MKSLDTKLAEIKADPFIPRFHPGRRQDADMAFGVRSPGPRSYLSLRGERPARFSPEIWSGLSMAIATCLSFRHHSGGG